MGVPIGDVARVSQVLLAKLQQDRTATEDRTTPGLITSEFVNTTAVQSSGNVQTQSGFFLGDAGLLSNVNVGLQRVTDIGNVTTNTITSGGYYTDGVDIFESNITAYDKITLNSINIPRYMTRSRSIGISTSLQLDISEDAQTIAYAQYGESFRVVKIDSFFNILSDTTINNPVTWAPNFDASFGRQVAVSSDGLTVACGAVEYDGIYTGYFNSGKVFIYRYDGQNWNHIGAIDRSSEDGYSEANRIRFSNSGLGRCLSLSGNGNTLVVGAGEDNFNGGNVQLSSGAAYVYTYNGLSWQRQAELFSTSRSQYDSFGSSVFINKAGDKIAIGCTGKSEVYIYNNLSRIHLITNSAAPDFGNKVAISEDGNTMATVSNNGHHIYKYDGEEWLESFYSYPVNYLPNLHVSVTPDGNQVIINGKRYIYFEGAWSLYQSYSGYAKINGDGNRVVDNTTMHFSTPDPLYKLDVAGDANVFEMHALRYYGDGGTLSNIVLEDNIILSSINYNSANVSGSNTFNLHTTDTITTTYGGAVNLVDIDSTGTRVVVGTYQASYLPVVYDYNGSSWSATQLTSATFGGVESVWDLAISSHGNTIVIASGYNSYAWRYNGSSWTESKYTQTNGEGTHATAVSGDGNVILVANVSDSNYRGRVYSFINGTYTGSFVSSISSGDSRFGSILKLNYDGTRAAIPDQENTGTNTGNGRIFLYSRSGTVWTNYKTFYVGSGGTSASMLRTFSISEDFNTLVYNLGRTAQEVSRLYINEFINGVWEEDTYPDGNGITVAEVSKNGKIILAGGDILYKAGDTWIRKTSYGYSAIALANMDSDSLIKVVWALATPDFSIGEIRRDSTLNIDAANVNITGTLTKASGTFKIDHPLPTMQSTHTLTHSFIEGPKADLIYRGKAQLSNGTVNVNIDEVSKMTEGTFEALTRDTQCFVSNETNWDAVRGVVDGNSITIHSQNTTSNSVVSWLVIGERKDKHMYTLDWTDNDGRVVPEKLKM